MRERSASLHGVMKLQISLLVSIIHICVVNVGITALTRGTEPVHLGVILAQNEIGQRAAGREQVLLCDGDYSLSRVF